MFQLDTDDFVRLLCKLLDFVAVSRGQRIESGAGAVHLFVLVRDFGKAVADRDTGGLEIVPPSFLETNQDSAPNRSSGRTNFKHAFAVHGPRLKIEKIARIDDRLSAHGQTKRRQILGYLHAERRIVHCEPSRERIDCEHRCLRRKTKHGLDVSALGPVACQLDRGSLEETIAEKVRRICEAVRGKLLAAAK